jgi:dihydrofolate reductase
MIVAVSPEGVIGLHGKIPWHHRADLQRFKRVTMGGTLIMGRLTWESIGRPLPGRRNVVVTQAPELGAGVECFRDLESALATCTGPVWFIGGARIFAEAMRFADFIDVTWVPDHVDAPGAVHMPPIDERIFAPGPRGPHPDDPALELQTFCRRQNIAGFSRR